MSGPAREALERTFAMLEDTAIAGRRCPENDACFRQNVKVGKERVVPRGDQDKIKVGIAQAAAWNVIMLPATHPAYERSLKQLERLCAEARCAADKTAFTNPE